MNVLFLNPPWIENGREGIRAGSRWPYTKSKLGGGDTIPFPFSLAYSASILKNDGFGVDFIDGIASKMSLSQFYNELNKKNPDFIIFETSTPSYLYDKKIAETIKSEFKNAKLAFCGTHPSVFPEEVAKESHIDYVLIGEYEYTLKELANKMAKNESVDDIKGVGFQKNNQTVVNERRDLIDIDELPFPARELLPIYRYNDSFSKYKPNVQLMSSRGCVFKCSFCVWPRVMYGGQIYRTRTAKNVVDEIEYLIANYKFKEIYFDDDAINLKEKHVEDLCDEIESRDINIPWSCMGHAKIKRELLEHMYHAGCEGIKFGVETGDKKILKSLKKGVTKRHIRETFKSCKEVGIRTHATFTLGLPGETEETIKDTIKFLFELDPDSAQYSITVPFPGTPFYEEAEEKGWLLTDDWSKFDGNREAIIKTEDISPESLERYFQHIDAAWGTHMVLRNPIVTVGNFIRCRGVSSSFREFPRALKRVYMKYKESRKIDFG